MITGKTLYDSDGNQFYPYCDANYIYTNIVSTSSILAKDLTDIYNEIKLIKGQVSGEETINGQLQIDVYYKNSTESSEENIISGGENEWNEKMTPPDSSAPYCWKRTRYYWIVDKSVPTPFKTVYEICATALYPETQVMYTAITGVPKKPLEGPKDYGDSSNDRNNDGETVWKNYFEGIDGSKTQGYMATRHRDAGKNWPEDGGWKLALFAQYPTEEIQQPIS